jgi:hypothetical protein
LNDELEIMLRRADAAAYIKREFKIPCSRQTLAKYAVIGGGPAYHLVGRYPMYRTADLDDWVASRRCGPFARTRDARSSNR